MNYLIRFSLLLCIMAMRSIPLNATIRYVKANATGLNDGTSWANAYTSLQSATSDTIWIAAGTYKPTNSTNRNLFFSLGQKNVYGGFAGTETDISQRNLNINHTILSGDIGIVGDSTDNSYTVVRLGATNNISLPSLMDGVTIEGGYGDEFIHGGVYLQVGMSDFLNMTFNNCIFRNNVALSGGAMKTSNSGYVYINNCIFEGNRALSTGGAINYNSSQLGSQGGAIFNIKDSRFVNNSAPNGGALAFGGNYGSPQAHIDRCIFAENTSGNNGGAIYATFTGPYPGIISRITNCLFVGNNATANGALYYAKGLRLFNCTIANNKSDNGTALTIPFNGKMENSIVWDNVDTLNQTATDQIALGTSGTTNGIASNSVIQNTTLPLNFTFDPQFMNPATVIGVPFEIDDYDYRPIVNSPVIDLAVDSTVTYTLDLAGEARVYGIHADLGCYEYANCTFTQTGVITSATDTLYCPGDSIVLNAPSGTYSYYWIGGGTSVSKAVYGPGTYTVILTNATGCQTQVRKTIADRMLRVSISGNTTPACGAFTTLTATGNYVTGYLWNNGPVTASNAITSSGGYFVTVTNGQGCSISSDTLEVVISPFPDTTIATITASSETLYCVDDTITLNGPPGFTYSWQNGSSSAARTVSEPGTYSLTITNTYGCQAVVHKTIIDQVLTVAVAGDTAPPCGAVSTILTASGNYIGAYLWSNGVNTSDNEITTSGDYYVTVTNIQGCSIGSDTLHVHLREIPLPVITANQDTLETTSAFPSYQWQQEEPAGSGVFLDITGATSRKFRLPSGGGKFRVSVTSADTCENTSNVYSYQPLSASDLPANVVPILYPNPVKDMLHIMFSVGFKVGAYTIFDVLGRRIHVNNNSVATAERLDIPLPDDLPAGVYWIRLQSEDCYTQARFIKAK